MAYYPRLLQSPLTATASRGKVRIIFGARQTGKSTLMQQLVDPSTVYFNLQERRTRLELERDPAVFSRQLTAHPGRRFRVVVDEIQKVPALLDEAQWHAPPGLVVRAYRVRIAFRVYATPAACRRK